MRTNIIKKFQLGFISLSAVAVLAACGNGTQEEAPPTTEDPVEDTQTSEEATNQEDTTNQDDTTGSQDQGTTDTSNGILGVEFQVTLDQAIQTFYDTFGEEANIDEIEFDSDFGVYEYNISGWDDQNEYDLEVNAESGDIKEQDTESDNDQDDILELENILTPQEAMEIAVEESGSDVVDDWSLEADDGRTIYEINMENGDDISIDATNGEVVDR